VLVFFGQESECVLDVHLVKLRVALQTEDVDEFVEVDLRLLLEHFAELLFLLLVGREPNHFEDVVEALQVDVLRLLVRLQHEDLSEVRTVGGVDLTL